jgi:hypothetical protein
MGFEHATFPHAAQCLNFYATAYIREYLFLCKAPISKILCYKICQEDFNVVVTRIEIIL